MAKNSYFERKIDHVLRAWASEDDRKPLLLRGARQVGKSSAVRNLAKSFKNYVEVNFDDDKDVHILFERFNSPQEICGQLSLRYKKEIAAGQTLVFFDEIQSCPAALAKVRYFYEKYLELLIMAGLVIPIEVKSGTKGAMPSLRLFMQEKNSEMGIRTSLENFRRIGNIEICPLYAISNVV